MIAEHLPGVSNPIRLPVDEFNGYLLAIVDKFNAQAGVTDHIDHRAHVEAEMRKAQRGRLQA